MSLGTFPPLQFNFSKFWFEEFKHLRKEPRIISGLDNVSASYREIAEFKHDEHCEHDPEQAALEFELDLLKSQIMVRDLHRLQKTFEGIDLYPLVSVEDKIYLPTDLEIQEVRKYF